MKVLNTKCDECGKAKDDHTWITSECTGDQLPTWYHLEGERHIAEFNYHYTYGGGEWDFCSIACLIAWAEKSRVLLDKFL